jgi:hypothetical protein
MRRIVIVFVLAAGAVFPTAAQAGGWATVTLAPPPAGIEADETWTANLSVLRHGVTPTSGAAPWITIRGPSGVEAFAAKPAGKPGAYVARVVFPAAGSWDYDVSDGLASTGYGVSTTHTYAPIVVAPRTGGGGGGVPAWPFALAAIALVVFGAVALAGQRVRRPAPQG